MPHVRLEYTADLSPMPDTNALFRTLHAILVDVAGVGAANVKSRASAVDSYVGDGDPSNAFVHLDVQLMEGRSEETKAGVADACLQVLVTAFSEAERGRDLQVTVDVTDLNRATYAKHPPGSLPPAQRT